MSTQNTINIDYTAVDFDALKAELITYLRETKSFKDVDYASSNINTITGLYAYIGSLFGFYINSIANEPFLPSAKRYKNLNRIARLLAYNPRGYKSASLDVIGSLAPEYCYGKEGEYFEIPAYSIFPSNKKTNNGDAFSFTNNNTLVYMVKGFGIRPVESKDFTYNSLPLPFTATGSFWETEGTTGSPSFNPEKLELTLSDTKPLSVLNRLDPSNYKKFDTVNVPLFDPNSSSSVGQPFNRNIQIKKTTLRIIPEKNYYVAFNYDKEQSSPSIEILEDGAILEEKRDSVITVIRLVKEDASGNYYTLKEVQNNAKDKFYVGVLGLNNLDSVEFNYDLIESLKNSVKRIHLDINKSGDKPPFQVLVNGEIYSFSSGRISSQEFSPNTWDVNQPYYNVNLAIVTPDAPEFNYDAKLNVTTSQPGVNEITIGKIYPSYVDKETQTPSISREPNQRFGNFQVVPKILQTITEQKSGVVNFADGIESVFISFDKPFTQDVNNETTYAISLTPSENVQIWYSGKSEKGFIINIEPNVGFAGSVSWSATKINIEETRETQVTFDSPIPQINGADADYSIFLTSSDNIRVWYEEKTSAGFKIKCEKSFDGTVSYSTFIFSNDQAVKSEINSTTQKKGSITLSGDTVTRDIVFDSEFSNTNYGLHMIANKNVNVWYTNKTISGFTINVESTDGNVNIDWFADYSEGYVYQKHGMISFSGQITSAGSLPGMRFTNVSETFELNNLKQGTVKFSYINSNGIIDNTNNGLGLAFTADRKSVNEIKFQVGSEFISYSDLRVFVKNDSGAWEEWANASNLSVSADVNVGNKIFFSRIEDTKKLEIKFGDGVNYGVDPYGREIIIFGLTTVGVNGNVPPNSVNTFLLSKNILSDDNITIQFEQQFVQLLGLKSSAYFSSTEPTNSTVIYDSEGTKIDSTTLKILQNIPAYGGADSETTEELRSSASSANLRQDRVVSVDDYSSFVQSAFNDIVLRAQALTYNEAKLAGFISETESKYFFNYIFLVILPQLSSGLTKNQKDYILSTLKKKYKSMATVEHDIFSAKLVPIDIRVRFKVSNSGSVVSAKTLIEKTIRDYFNKNNHEMGETLTHSTLVSGIINANSSLSYVEVALSKNLTGLTENDYKVSAVTDINETVQEVKRKKILELLGKDPTLLNIVQPLFSVTDSTTNKKEYPFTLNVTMEKYEFPILGKIITEAEVSA